MVRKETRSVLGENLARLRDARALSQEELAQGTEGVVSQADVSRIESGSTVDPSAWKLLALAKVLKVDMLEFFGEAQGSDDEIERSLEDFLNSPIAADISKAEEEELRRTKVPFGRAPTDRTWFHLLEAIRSSSK